MFYFYQTNVLKGIAFYLHTTQSKVSHYYCAEYMFNLLIMIKREILELSHPFLHFVDPLRTGNPRMPLSHKYTELVECFLLILSALLEGSSKHL